MDQIPGLGQEFVAILLVASPLSKHSQDVKNKPQFSLFKISNKYSNFEKFLLFTPTNRSICNG